jgi:hypothetical protein
MHKKGWYENEAKYSSLVNISGEIIFSTVVPRYSFDKSENAKSLF